MRFTPRFAGALLLASACLVPAAAAPAQGAGEDIRHVKNIPFPNLNAAEEVNAGTDLEFATITIPSPAAVVVDPPVVDVPAAKRPAPKAKAKSKKAKKKKRKRPVCKTRKQKRTKACKREAARKRAAARKKRKAQRRDAAPGRAGLQRTFAFVGSYGDGLQVIDITDPANAVLVATWNCGVSQGDVQVFQRADLGGRWFVAYTQDDGYDFYADATCARDLKARGVDTGDGSGTYIADVSDPYNPKTVSFIPFSQGSHNGTVHPSGKWFYNSNSDLITSPLPAVEIADITNIEAPKVVGEVALTPFPGLGTESHDIGFNKDGTRAYVAALSHGEILDTTNPAEPVSVGTILDPAINVWHELEEITITDPILGKRDFLIAEDEFVGALETGQCPNGGVHVYDATGDLEAAPVKVGYWNITDTGPTENGLGRCTAHVFQLHEEQQLMTIAYYNGGVRVVDLSGLVGVALGRDGAGMKEVGSFRFPDSDTWAAKAPVASRSGFFFYGNDHKRGFDVYEWKPPADGMRRTGGRWLTPAQVLSAATRLRERGTVVPGALCLLGKRRQLS